jgi:formyltetrahydrofolate deformylase
MTGAILTISCPDKKGLVAAISNFIYQNNGNIINMDQYSDSTEEKFFMRLEWDLREFAISRDQVHKSFKDFADDKSFKNNWDIFFTNQKPKAAIFVSKYDHCLYDLLLRNKSGELNCDIALIISNHPDLEYAAKTFDKKFVYLPVSKTDKEAVEQKQLGILIENKIDFIILARYMQILSSTFIKSYKNKIINVHHSFLPAFKGAKPYHQAFERGVKIIGATSHFVTEDLDQGPIIQQEVDSISHKDTVEDLIVKGRDMERKVLAQAVRLFIDHRLFVCGNRTIIF